MPAVESHTGEVSNTASGPEADATNPAEVPASQIDVAVRQAVRIGPLRLLLDFSSTSRLSEMVPITPVPAAPAWLRGLASLRGSVLPVVDLAALGGIELSSATRHYLLVLGHGETAIAILIDGLPERFRLLATHGGIPHSAPDWLSRSVVQAYTHSDEVWLDLNCGCLLDDIAEHMKLAVAQVTS